MGDFVITGATRGIGRALALAIAASIDARLILVARDRLRLDPLVSEIVGMGRQALALPADLASVASARRLGEELADTVRSPATLVHNAGVWPSRRVVTSEGLETAFVVNHLAPLALQQTMLERSLLNRMMVISAGLIVQGRFDPIRTPVGDDFSSLRTYCTTKLCLAVMMRDIAVTHPEVDMVVLHPGVVRTELGARSGPVGWLLSLVKRRWETPETCAARLVRILSRPRWSQPGTATWMVEETEQPWPEVAENEPTRQAVRETTARLLARR